MADSVDDLIAEIAQLKRDVATQREEDGRVIGVLGAQLDEISELLGTKSPEFLLSPWWWPAMNPKEARAAWDVLVPWVDDVLIGRYDTRSAQRPATDQDGKSNLAEGDNIKQCWFAHVDVLDKLSALWWAWKGDYRRHAPARGPIEFQETWVPRTLEQIRPKMVGCLGGCPHLGRKAGEVSWDHRAAWIHEDVNAPHRGD